MPRAGLKRLALATGKELLKGAGIGVAPALAARGARKVAAKGVLAAPVAGGAKRVGARKVRATNLLKKKR